MPKVLVVYASVPSRRAAWLLIGCVLSACSVYDASLLKVGQSSPPIMAAGGGSSPAQPGPVLDASGASVDAGQAMDPDSPTPKVDAAMPQDVTRCGDGQITGTEKCDIAIEAGKPGACPTDCPELELCVPRSVSGSACQATCVLRQLLCQNDDECCPGNCTREVDNDCSAQCGDKHVQEDVETCEPGTEMPCKTSVAECDDKNACTTDALIGSVANCNSACSHTPVTEPKAGDGCCPMSANANTDSDCKAKCGNGVKETGEECDGGTTCDAMCRNLPQNDMQKCTANAKDACDMCACMNCAVHEVACRYSIDATFNTQCGAIIDCARKNNCLGTACLGSRDAPGPCRKEIETAAGVMDDPLFISFLSSDITNVVGRSYAVDMCRTTMCPTTCR